MYWIPKMYKTPIGARFIIVSKNCCKKPLSDTTPIIFNMIFTTVESLQSKSFIYPDCKKFWIVQIPFPIATKSNKINVGKKAKSIPTFDFGTLYTTIPHELLIKLFSKVIKFDFKSQVRKRIGFSKTSIYCTSKETGRRYFTKQAFVNEVFKQDIVLPVGIESAPFWDNLFPFLFESKYIKQLTSNGCSKAYLYRGVSRFTDNLCVINDGNEFITSFKNTYPTELELKIEYQGNYASSFLETDIKMLLHQTILCYHTGYHMGHMDITMCYHMSNF